MPLAAPSEYQFRTEVNPDGTFTIYKGRSCLSFSVVLPDTILGVKVTSVGRGAFSMCSGLYSITIPESFTSVGASAFSRCVSLTNVTIQGGVTNIGPGAFENCVDLRSVVIANRETTISGNAFAGCPKLEYVRIGNGAMLIGKEAHPVGSTTIPSSIGGLPVTHLGAGLFGGSTDMTTVAIPDSVTHIGDQAFKGCSSLPHVAIPDSVASIEYGAFEACTGLTCVDFEGNAPEVWPGTFGHPTNLRHQPGTKGWSSTFDGRPTALWVRPNPTILDFGDGFGLLSNGLSFVVSWATNVPVVVEASADLAAQGWMPISTNTLTDGWVQFTDPEWKRQPARFYRVRGQ